MDFVLTNPGSFNQNKQNIWLWPKNLVKAKWGTCGEDSSVPSSSTATVVSSKKKRLRKKEVSLKIEEPAGWPRKSCRTEASKRPVTIVDYPSSDDDDDDTVIVPFVRRRKISVARPVLVTEGVEPSTIIEPITQPSRRPSGSSCWFKDLPTAQPPNDEWIPDIPSVFTGEVSDWINNPSEGISAGHVVRATEAEEAAAMIKMATTVEVAKIVEEYAVEPLVLENVETPCLAIQLYSPVIMQIMASKGLLVEDGVRTSLAEEVEVATEDYHEMAESPAFGDAALAPEAGAEFSMVQEAATIEPGEPRAPRGEGTFKSSFVTKLQDIAGGLNAIIAEVSQAYADLEASRSLGSRIQSLEVKLAEAESCISILEGQLKEQERLHVVLRGRNLSPEQELRTSLKPEDIAPTLERKYWDAVDMCRQVMKLLVSRFLIAVFNPRNSSAQHKDDLVGLPNYGRSTSPLWAGLSGSPKSSRQSGSSERAGPSAQ